LPLNNSGTGIGYRASYTNIMKKQPDTVEKNNILFWGLIVLEIVLVFTLNLNHQNQQFIFEHRYLPLSNALLHGEGYSVLYPMWGYSFLLIIGFLFSSPVATILAIQGILCVASIWLIYRYYALLPKLFHVALFLPFIALLSVKWPDAIVAFLLVAFAYHFKKYLEQKRILSIVFCGVIEGLILNFRSEYLYLGIIIVFISLFYRFPGSVLSTIKFVVVSTVIAICCLIPWGLNTYNHSGVFRLGSSNSGLVLFTTLGQLPNNPWGITPTDQFGEDYVHSHNLNDAYSNSGDSLLSSTFVTDIEGKPLAYVEKTGYNFVSIFFRGLYTGEYSQVTGVELIDKIIKVVFIPIFTLMIGWFFYSAYQSRKTSSQRSFLWLPVVAIVSYKIMLVCLIQYEPRHMNSVYLLILVGVLSTLADKNNRR
jgi:hypothetical protein